MDKCKCLVPDLEINECKNCWNDNLDEDEVLINLEEGIYCTGCMYYDEERKELRMYKHYH